MQIDILLFDGFDELDGVAPYEVFRTARAFGADVDASLVGAHGAATVTGSHGARFIVDRGVGADAEVLIVPGGGWGGRPAQGAWAEVQRGDLPRLVRAAHERGATVASVCTGAMIVAAAGLTAGRPAVTHRDAMQDLEASGAVVTQHRVVDDGDLLSCGGVTAGLDLALWMVERAAGRTVADQTAAEIEHERTRDIFRRGTATSASPARVSSTRA